ncbi:RNA polymerase sigma factor [Mucilaginibacter polytrichastri]|uniref:RNA polymerase sigma factor n=2 Tax=Mucilaginibacter polytrichastri TaxID=1302689 RepID=UPI0008F10EAD|nr:RNA polymerase sigma-70 factor [Mucilaginibacter polytrichastri]SFT05253.1 RNA polymerase sigma-70 factor, ECF subfamily [Mucilaginibacter polytrichastri]
MAIKPLNDETELLAKVVQGDQRAFTTIFDYYQKYVFGFGLKLTYSEDLAEEIVQDIFLKVWYGRDKLNTIESFGAYLNRLVRNHAFNLLRQVASHAKANKRIGEGLSELDNSTQHDLDLRETTRLLDEAIQLLPLQQKKIYILCRQEGLKYEEAAQQLNISPDTVHYHMKLALNAIREHFKRNALSYPPLIFLLLLNK